MLLKTRDEQVWRVRPDADQRRRFTWRGGAFETGRRGHADSVEGHISSDVHLVMATLKGGAQLHEYVTDEGFRFSGSDRPGYVSYLPANCARRLRLRNVSWEWAAIALPVDGGPRLSEKPFTTRRDDFLFGMLSQFQGLYEKDSALDVTYCDAMTLALRTYLVHRSGVAGRTAPHVSGGLTPRQVRDVTAYIESRLTGHIRITELAAIAGLSEGYFHRAFRQTNGQSPLEYVNRKRVERALALLAQTDKTVIEIALDSGFAGPSHFARTFRSIMGVAPQQYRRSL
ncbi:AraC family transcriptional regulator [Sinorhizobium sp. 7-81]|uniref:AraC family transcriptional regulator n=1 Tax=Sinorhizobium sp. 8-89 TaxID=3049089 RepID=UPI0024C2BB4A|nr:AraC family transcriptional regulator [Sinorhizobium sp. 8-89]MDK1491453.1 AraC family transcriptional regulator [Sinorhizobium sp. 8-89]